MWLLIPVSEDLEVSLKSTSVSLFLYFTWVTSLSFPLLTVIHRTNQLTFFRNMHVMVLSSQLLFFPHLHTFFSRVREWHAWPVLEHNESMHKADRSFTMQLYFILTCIYYNDILYFIGKTFYVLYFMIMLFTYTFIHLC